jgi:hypothetical protein
MSIRSWLENLRKPREKKPPEDAADDLEKQLDARKADVGGTLFVRGSAKSEAQRLSRDV